MKLKGRKSISYGIKATIILASIGFISYAWLNSNGKIEAERFYIQTHSYSELLVSLDDGETWDTNASIDMLSDAEFKTEITGNGINFYYATNKRDDGVPVSFARTTRVNQDYFEFNILFKANANGGIFLQRSSFLKPQCGTGVTDLIGNNVERKSSSGAFSTDLIASSMRVAFVENDYVNNIYIPKSHASMVWAPNKNYEVMCDASTCSATINSNNLQEYKYVNATDVANISYDYVDNIRDEIRTNYLENSANGDLPLGYIDTNENDGVKKITVRIWVEGNDRDNLTALTGGMFVISLNFTIIDKQLNTSAPNVSVSNNTISGLNNSMEYSTDRGLNYIAYDGNTMPTFNNNDIVYVRYAENSSAFASTPAILSF